MKVHSPLFLAVAMAAKSNIQEIKPEALQEKLARHQKLYLVDIREVSEWQQGYIAGAIHLSKGVLERDIEKNITNTDAEIVVYCSGGYRSALAAESLQNMGYKNVASLEGGLSAWQALGLPIQQKH